MSSDYTEKMKEAGLHQKLIDEANARNQKRIFGMDSFVRLDMTYWYEVFDAYENAFRIYKQYNKRTEAEQLIKSLIELASAFDIVEFRLIVRLISIIKVDEDGTDDIAWLEKSIPDIRGQLATLWEKALRHAYSDYDMSFLGLLGSSAEKKNAFEVWHSLEADETKRRIIDQFHCRTLELAAHHSRLAGNLALSQDHFAKAAHVAKQFDPRLSGLLLQYASAMAQKLHATPIDPKSIEGLLNLSLLRSMQKAGVDRFIMSPENFLSEYAANPSKLSTILKDERLLVNNELIQEAIDRNDDVLADFAPMRFLDGRGNVRSDFLEGRDSKRSRLELRYISEIVDVVAILFESWNEQGLISFEDISQIAKASGLPIDWRIFEYGIEVYFRGDFISACHILIPQFENIFRTWVRANNIPIKKLSQTKAIIWGDILLTDLVRDEEIKRVIGEGFFTIIDWFMASPMSMGYRHQVTHGFINVADCNEVLAATTIWLALKILSLPISSS